ncbi:hypothetical protein EON81_14220 [bacterium]|nr:MAG: hypothetical protein EON81_14220 [bacterium]
MLLSLLFAPRAEGRPVADIPFSLQGVHIFVMAKVNGQGPFPMNIDTGGGMGLSLGLARKLGISSEGDIVGGGAGGNTVKFGMAKNLSVGLGGVTLSGLSGTIDGNLEDAAAGIGPELFQAYTVAFDYDRLRMRLYPKGTIPALPKASKLSLRLQDDGKPLILVKVGDQEGWFMADTGGGVSLIVQKNFWQPRQVDRQSPKLVKAIVGYGVGGPIYGRFGRLPKLSFGGIDMPNSLASFSDMTQGTLSNPKRAGIIGQRILRRFNVVFDYANASVYLTPNEAFARPASFGRTGLSGLAEGYGYPVDYVIKGSAGERAGMRKGDVIVAIDGQRLDETSAAQAFARAEGTRLKLLVLRGDRTFETTLVLREVL